MEKGSGTKLFGGITSVLSYMNIPRTRLSSEVTSKKRCLCGGGGCHKG